jgi:hypothetical protein
MANDIAQVGGRTVENPDKVSPSGSIPNTPNPDDGKGIPFSLSFTDTNSGGDYTKVIEFNPVYYPDRYTDTLKTDVSRDARQSGGEDVSVDQTKNPEFHATGIVLDGNVSDFRKIRKYDGPVNLITPITDNEGGMEVIVTKGEIGQLVGWDGLYKQWQFNYTLDMVATGSDTGSSGRNPIVSEVLEKYRGTDAESKYNPRDNL